MILSEKQNVEFIQGAVLEPIAVITEIDGDIYTVNVPSLARLRLESGEADFYDVKIDIKNPVPAVFHFCKQKRYTPHDTKLIDHHEAAAIFVLQREGVIDEFLHVTEEQINAYLNSKDIKMPDREISDLFKSGGNYWEKLGNAQRGVAERRIMDEIFVGVMPKKESDLTKILANTEFYGKINAIRKWSTLCKKYAPEQIKGIDRWEVTLARVMSDYELIIGGKLNLKWSQNNVRKLSDLVLGNEYLTKKDELLAKIV